MKMFARTGESCHKHLCLNNPLEYGYAPILPSLVKYTKERTSIHNFKPFLRHFGLLSMEKFDEEFTATGNAL